MSDKHEFTPESLYEMRGVSNPQVAPDGKRVAFVNHWIEMFPVEGKERPVVRSAIMISDGPGSEPRRLTWSKTGNAATPRWSPDGSALAFLSTSDGNKPQLFVLDMRGGEAQPVTQTKSLSEGVVGFDWHPDGNAFCFLSAGHKSEDECRAEELHDEKVYENRLPFKFDGRGLLPPRRTQLWRVERDGSAMTQLMEFPFDVEYPAWSPDGKEIAFAGVPGREYEWTYITDIFVFDVESKETRQLTPSIGPVGVPVWLPDGQRIAFIGHNNRSGNATNLELWVVGRNSGGLRCLTENFDRSVGTSTMGDMHFAALPTHFAWHGNRLYFTLTDHGQAGIASIPATGGAVERIDTGELSVLNLTVAGDTIAFAGETSTRTAEIYTMTTAGKELQRRSHSGDAVVARYDVIAPEHVTFHGADNWEIEGWSMKPTGYTEGQHYPLLLYIHGGPHSDYGNGFFHEFQVLAHAGYGLFYVNPRGGRSYGEAFTDAVRGHYAEKDYEDLMRAADLAASWDWVDQERMGVVGGSYGGFMTNWIITHTDRFAAACTQRSITNWVSFAGTSDIGPEFTREELSVMPWENEELLMAKSPIRYVKNVKTPTLILHQENDHRCPIEQGEQLYTALVCLGVPTKFVRFPEEGHGLSRSGQPQRRVNRMHHIIDWFDRYLQPRAE